MRTEGASCKGTSGHRLAVRLKRPAAVQAPLIRLPVTAYMALGNYFSQRGFVTIVVDYRRIPDTGKFPDSAEDLSLSLQWLAKEEVKEADLNNVFYLGASAG